MVIYDSRTFNSFTTGSISPWLLLYLYQVKFLKMRTLEASFNRGQVSLS